MTEIEAASLRMTEIQKSLILLRYSVLLDLSEGELRRIAKRVDEGDLAPRHFKDIERKTIEMNFIWEWLTVR